MENASPTTTPADPHVAATRTWLERAVIGLNLCPFAKAVHIKDQVRFFVSAASTPEELTADLIQELLYLVSADPAVLETTLLIHPHALQDFLDFNDFLEVVEQALVDLELDGEIQVASFHPKYQFAGSAPDDIENYTNRAPYPTLHLLREASIDAAVLAFPDAADIFDKNIRTMQQLGHEGWRHLLTQVT